MARRIKLSHCQLCELILDSRCNVNPSQLAVLHCYLGTPGYYVHINIIEIRRNEIRRNDRLSAAQ